MTNTSFYNVRHLPEPADEHWPADARALKALVVGAKADAALSVFGGGQHIRDHTVGAPGWEAVRTDHCRKILELDRQSQLVRVEAGIRWGDLRRQLREEGFSLHGYRPYPQVSSVGGLLGRHHPHPAQRFGGDLRAGCVGLSAAAPTLGEYEYMEAPRKASGPDLRYLFIGGEARLGVILTATLRIDSPLPARLIEHPAADAAAAVACRRTLDACGIRSPWCHWRRSTGAFRAIVYAPTRLLDAMVDRLDSHWGGEVEVAGDEAARACRRDLEADMPDQRSRPAAARTLQVTHSLAQLADAVDGIEAAEEVDILDWSTHAATAFVAIDDTVDIDAFADTTLFAQALAARPTVAAHEAAPMAAWQATLIDRFDGVGRLFDRR